jgi:hypothetical protein
MDFAALPPEVNSGRLYAGPGSGPMIAAAASWDSLATEVSLAAGDYGSVISCLTSGPWRGLRQCSRKPRQRRRSPIRVPPEVVAHPPAAG